MVEVALLEAELLAVALWDLGAQGHLDISGEPKPRGLFQGPRHGFGNCDPFWLRFTPYQTASRTSGLEGELLSALGDSASDLDELINDRWLRGRTLAVNGVVVFAQREALSRGLLYMLPSYDCIPKSLEWSKSIPRYIGDSPALEQFKDAAIQLAENVVRLDKSARNRPKVSRVTRDRMNTRTVRGEYWLAAGWMATRVVPNTTATKARVAAAIVPATEAAVSGSLTSPNLTLTGAATASSNQIAVNAAPTANRAKSVGMNQSDNAIRWR